MKGQLFVIVPCYASTIVYGVVVDFARIDFWIVFCVLTLPLRHLVLHEKIRFLDHATVDNIGKAVLSSSILS